MKRLVVLHFKLSPTKCWFFSGSSPVMDVAKKWLVSAPEEDVGAVRAF